MPLKRLDTLRSSSIAGCGCLDIGQGCSVPCCSSRSTLYLGRGKRWSAPMWLERAPRAELAGERVRHDYAARADESSGSLEDAATDIGLVIRTEVGAIRQ